MHIKNGTLSSALTYACRLKFLESIFVSFSLEILLSWIKSVTLQNIIVIYYLIKKWNGVYGY